MRFLFSIIALIFALAVPGTAQAQFDKLLQGLGNAAQDLRNQLEQPKQEQSAPKQAVPSTSPSPDNSTQKAEEERKRQEAARKAEQERKRKEATQKAEEERKRQEAARKAEEERKQIEAAKRAEEERKRQEAADPEIDPDKKLLVALSSTKKNEKREEERCDLTFSIKNQSYGSLYELLIRLEVTDDRGDSVRSRSISYEPRAKLPIGEIGEVRITANTKCAYVKTIKFVKADKGYCNMRMLPEIDDCLKLISARSDVDGVSVVK